MDRLFDAAESVESGRTEPEAAAAPGPSFPKAGIPQVSTRTLWLTLPVLVVLWRGWIQPLLLLDFWWHLKAGEVIFTTFSIPRVDLFSFTAAGSSYVLQNWLAEVFYYLLYQLGGYSLLIAVNGVMLAAGFALVLQLCREEARHWRVAVPASLVAVLALSSFANARPQVFSILFFALFYWVLQGWHARRRDRLWCLPVVMAVWVNCHGGFVLGLLLVAIYGALPGLERAWRGCSPVLDRRWKRLALIGALTGAATLLNPEGVKVYDYVWTVMNDPASQLFVSEWQPPRIDQGRFMLIFFSSLFAGIVLFAYSLKTPAPLRIILFLIFSALALKSSRNIVWFALIYAPIAAGQLSSLAVPRWVRAGSRGSGRFNFLLLSSMCLLTVSVLPWADPVIWGRAGPAPPGVERRTPVAAMDFLERRELEGRIFHPQEYGDYLIWRLWPRQRSFFDGRVHLFPEAFVREALSLPEDEHWENRLQKYDLAYLLLPKGDEEYRLMVDLARRSPRWERIYEDDLSILYAGTEPERRIELAASSPSGGR